MEEPDIFLIENYTNKSFVVVGETFPIKEYLKRSTFVQYKPQLKLGPGWLGSIDNLENTKAFLTRNGIHFESLTKERYNKLFPGSIEDEEPKAPVKTVKKDHGPKPEEVVMITNYTSGGLGHNSIAIVGENLAIADELKNCGLIQNDRLKIGKGWIGKGSKINAVRACIKGAGFHVIELTLEDFQEGRVIMNNAKPNSNLEPRPKPKPKAKSPVKVQESNLDTYIDLLMDKGASIVANYILERPDIEALIQGADQNGEEITLFVPNDEAIEHIQGLLREVSSDVILDELIENHVTYDNINFDDIKFTEPRKFTSINNKMFSYARKPKKVVATVPIYETLRTDSDFVNIYIISGMISTKTQHLNLVRH